MARAIAVVGAPSSIGIRPYDDGQERHLNRAPGVLRERGLVRRVGAIDLGDVVPPPYRDYERPPHRARNEKQVAAYSEALASRVAAATARGRFALVIGGDCSIVLGCLLGAGRSAGGPIGLAYVDAHADFATPQQSRTGSVASMCLGLATGRGRTPLARLAGPTPLAEARHTALLCRRDDAQGWYGHAALAESGLLDLPDVELRSRDFSRATASALEAVAAPGVAGFWIQLDVDAMNPDVMPAVDSPEPGGLMPGEMVDLLAPLVRHPRALGLSLTIYDPALDPDRAVARQLIGMLERLFTR
jgi:arginase